MRTLKIEGVEFTFTESNCLCSPGAPARIWTHGVCYWKAPGSRIWSPRTKQVFRLPEGLHDPLLFLGTSEREPDWATWKEEFSFPVVEVEEITREVSMG